MLVDVRVAASKVAEWRSEQRVKRAAITAIITGAAKEAEEGRREQRVKRVTITAAIREDAARRRMVSKLYRTAQSISSILCAYYRNPLVFLLFRARSTYNTHHACPPDQTK